MLREAFECDDDVPGDENEWAPTHVFFKNNKIRGPDETV